MRYSEDLSIPGVSNLAEPRLSVTSLEDKDQCKGSIIVYITERDSHQHAQNASFGLFAAARLLWETCRLHIRWNDIYDETHLATQVRTTSKGGWGIHDYGVGFKGWDSNNKTSRLYCLRAEQDYV